MQKFALLEEIPPRETYSWQESPIQPQLLEQLSNPYSLQFFAYSPQVYYPPEQSTLQQPPIQQLVPGQTVRYPYFLENTSYLPLYEYQPQQFVGYNMQKQRQTFQQYESYQFPQNTQYQVFMESIFSAIYITINISTINVSSTFTANYRTAVCKTRGYNTEIYTAAAYNTR